MVTVRTPVGDIVAKHPRAAAVFERHAIDYCCHGDRPLLLACTRARADPAVVLQQLTRVANESLGERDWTVASLGDLTAHIVAVHHAALRAGVASIAAWLHPGTGEGGATDIDGEVGVLFALFRAGLEPHLRREEEQLFPAIARLERIRCTNGPRPSEPAERFHAELPALVGEHRSIDARLRQLRRAAAEPGAEVVRPRRATAVHDLAVLEADVHRHLHLENNILFPRAIALEAAYE